MKNIFSTTKTTFAIILAFGLSVVATLHSCNKAQHLESTEWESSSFSVSAKEFIPWEVDSVTVEYTVTITVSFRKKEADIRVCRSFINPWTDILGNNYDKGTATYTYDKGKISLNVKWNSDNINRFDDGMWNGNAGKSTMTLNDVFRQAVVFKKK